MVSLWLFFLLPSTRACANARGAETGQLGLLQLRSSKQSLHDDGSIWASHDGLSWDPGTRTIAKTKAGKGYNSHAVTESRVRSISLRPGQVGHGYQGGTHVRYGLGNSPTPAQDCEYEVGLFPGEKGRIYIKQAHAHGKHNLGECDLTSCEVAVAIVGGNVVALRNGEEIWNWGPAPAVGLFAKVSPYESGASTKDIVIEPADWTATPGDWEYVGCYENAGAKRVEGYEGLSSWDECKDSTVAASADVFGMENPASSNEHGDGQCLVLGKSLPDMATKDDRDCEIDAAADKRLGGGNRLAVYRKTTMTTDVAVATATCQTAIAEFLRDGNPLLNWQRFGSGELRTVVEFFGLSTESEEGVHIKATLNNRLTAHLGSSEPDTLNQFSSAQLQTMCEFKPTEINCPASCEAPAAPPASPPVCDSYMEVTVLSKVRALCVKTDVGSYVTYTGVPCGDGTSIEYTRMKTPADQTAPRAQGKQCEWEATPDKTANWKSLYTGSCGVAPTEVPDLPTKCTVAALNGSDMIEIGAGSCDHNSGISVLREETQPDVDACKAACSAEALCSYVTHGGNSCALLQGIPCDVIADDTSLVTYGKPGWFFAHD